MENFDKVMSQKTDAELIRIVTIESSKYQPSAVESAQKEIAIRNIDLSTFQEIAEKVTIENQTQKAFDASIVSSAVRFVNMIVDLISCYLIYFTLTSVSILVFDIESYKNVLPFYFIMFISFIGYYTFMEYTFQKTLGKFITKTKVVNLNGEKPNLNDIINRTFCRLIPFDRLSFFFAKNGFHDGISNTRVIKD